MAAQLAELGRERNKLNLEKAELENTLEAEQEFIANRLQMQVPPRRASPLQILTAQCTCSDVVPWPGCQRPVVSDKA